MNKAINVRESKAKTLTSLLAVVFVMASAMALPQSALANYATSCAGCHNPLAMSSKKGKSASATKAAITANTGGMGTTALKALTNAQLNAIAIELGGSANLAVAAPATPRATPTATPRATPTATPRATPTATPRATPTATPRATPTATPRATPTATPRATPTATPRATPTPTPCKVKDHDDEGDDDDDDDGDDDRDHSSNECGQGHVEREHVQPGFVGQSKNGKPRSDAYEVTCANGTASLSASVMDLPPAKAPMISIQVAKGSATSPLSTDNVDGNVWFSKPTTLKKGAGKYVMRVNKSASKWKGAEGYIAKFSCKNAAGAITAGKAKVVQNQ